MADKSQDGKGRQRIIIIILVVVGGFLAWQMKSMFSGSSADTTAAANKIAANQPPPPPPMPAPKPADLVKAAPLTEREMQLMQLQQETEAKYVAAINELQMLKIQRDIAETNRAIASAKLDTVSAQKNIVSLLAPEQQPANYSQRLTNPTQGVPTGPGQQPSIEVAYTVISVSEIQGRWSAVLGGQGKLYNVHIGDILPGDNSKVSGINKYGVQLQKDGVVKTVSLVPII